MSAGPTPEPGDRRPDAPQNIATAIADVSERASLLVREEIELAKAEVTEKVTKLVKGAIVGVAAGVFFLMALIFVLVGCAWLLYFYLPVGDFAYFWGFFAMAAILIVLGVLAGLIAAKAVKKGSPPVPTMAIAEAQKIREAVSAPSAGPSPSHAGPKPPASASGGSFRAPSADASTPAGPGVGTPTPAASAPVPATPAPASASAGGALAGEGEPQSLDAAFLAASAEVDGEQQNPGEPAAGSED